MPVTRPRVIASRRIGASFRAPGCNPENRFRFSRLMPVKVSVSGPLSITVPSACRQKSPAGLWSGLPVMTSNASAFSGGVSCARSKSHQMSPLITTNHSSPLLVNRGNAWRIPPAVSRGSLSREYSMASPTLLPLPSSVSICVPSQAWLITTSRKPAAFNRSRWCTISGLPPADRSGFGVVRVSGRMRSPLPAARIIAFTGRMSPQGRSVAQWVAPRFP